MHARHDADVRVANHPEPLEDLLKRQVHLGRVMGWLTNTWRSECQVHLSLPFE